MGYMRPVPYTGISSYGAHTRRRPPSKEAGVDYYCPMGTPVRAGADGQVAEVGGSIYPATGRFVTVDFNDGRRARYLHLSRQDVRVRQFVRRGDVVGMSGASGYGSEFFGASSLSRIPANTGGPHVHTTLWPRHAYSFGTNAGTLDFEAFADSNAPASGGGTGDDDMPLSGQDLINILEAEFDLQQGDKTRKVSIADALRAVYWYGDTINKIVTGLPDEVWAHKLKHALNGTDTPAGDLLRYEPSEHAATRAQSAVTPAQVAAIADAVKAAIGQPTAKVDYAAIAKAVNDDAAVRLRS